MSTLRTFNLQHPESSNNNIQLAEGGGVSVTAGILTATNVSSTNVTTTEVTATNGTFSGNLSIGGVLSYEDVTNIDAVGVITARSDVSIADKIIHTGDTNTAIRFPAADTFSVETGGSERLRITSDGDLIMNGASPNHDASSGSIFLIPPSGNPNRGIKWSDTSDTHYVKLEPSVIDGLTINGYSGVAFATGSRSNSTWAERLRIDSTGNIGIGTETIQANINYNTLEIVGDAGTTGGGIIRLKTGNLAAKTMLFCDTGGFEARVETNHPFVISTNNTERLRITSDGKMGLGTQTPGQALSIAGNSAGLGIYNTGNNHGNVYFYKDGTSKGWLKYRGNDDKLVIGNVTDAIYVKTSGNVGVGNADPTQARLVAQTASGMSIAAIKENTGASISLGGITQPRILMEAGASASQFKLYTASGSSYSSAGWRQRLHVTDTSASVASTGSGANGIGCFGIADNSPDSRALALSIGGGNGLYGIEDSRPMVYLQRSYGIGGGSSTDETTLEVNAPGSYNSAGTIYGIKSRAQHNLNGSHYAGHFEGHGSQYSANGTSALYAKTTKLDTNGSGDVIAFRADGSVVNGIANNGAAIAGYFATGNNINCKPIVCQNGHTPNNWVNQIIFKKHNGSSIVQVGSIKSSNTATQYNTNSDYRLKENVISLTGAIDRLKQLQPKRFNFIGIDETIDGFIAHEVNPVAPYAVSGEKDAVKKELVLDEDGKEQFDENGEIIIEEVIDPQSVDYSKLTTLTIAALQEALAKIETLEAKVAILEG